MSSNFLIGKNIGNYRITSFIANGGFGTVYKGQHSILADRLVAIKVLRTVMLDSTHERDKFLREAQLLEKLKHPHILPIIDVGIHDDIPYIVTEYAIQGSLQERLQLQQQHPFSLQEAQAILLQVGQALHFAHQQRIIHRDLKPANILFNANGHAMLADFGIATLTESARTVSADAIGSPPYMAPEQFDGIVSMKSDQYALGCLAYELFTGRRPFQSPADPTWFAWRQKHLSEVPLAPTQLNSYLASSIEQALLKALAKDRLHRHADVATFVMALATPTLAQVYSPTQPSQIPTTSDKPSTTDPEQYKETLVREQPSPAEAELSAGNEPSQQKKGWWAKQRNQPRKQDKAEPTGDIARSDRIVVCIAYAIPLAGLIGGLMLANIWNSTRDSALRAQLGFSAYRSLIYSMRGIFLTTSYFLYKSIIGLSGVLIIIFTAISWCAVLMILVINLKKHFVRFHIWQAFMLVSLFIIISYMLLGLTGAAETFYYYGETSAAYWPLVIVDSGVASCYLIALCFGLRGASRSRYSKLPMIGTWAEKFANKVSRSNK